MRLLTMSSSGKSDDASWKNNKAAFERYGRLDHDSSLDYPNMAKVRTTANTTIHVKKQLQGVSGVCTEMVEIKSYVPIFFSA